MFQNNDNNILSRNRSVGNLENLPFVTSKSNNKGNNICLCESKKYIQYILRITLI